MDSVKVDEWNERFVRAGLQVYQDYWTQAEHPNVQDGMKMALNYVANAVAEELW